MSPARGLEHQLLNHVGSKIVFFPQIQNGFNGVLHATLGWKSFKVETGMYQSIRVSQPLSHNIPIHVSVEQGLGVSLGGFQDLVAGSKSGFS